MSFVVKNNIMEKNMKVDVSIGENFFAPKCVDRSENFDTRNSHAMAYSKCNFSCAFCKIYGGYA